MSGDTNDFVCPNCTGVKDPRSEVCRSCRWKVHSHPSLAERAEAQSRGQVRYVSSTPCLRGHFAERYTSSGHCIQCLRFLDGKPEPTRDVPEFCECCGRLPNGNGALHLDHSHTTGAFRGWLCSSCNMGLGAIGDSLDAILRAAAYLRRAEYVGR